MNILLTAGPTQELLDPVRYLTNASSGAMGLAIAGVLSKKNIRVTLVHGPVKGSIPSGVRSIPVQTALQMSKAVRRALPKSDVFIATAAVSDWRFAAVHSQKIKKEGRASLTVKMIPNPDILFDAGVYKKRRPSLVLVGFALETTNVEKNARQKMKKKNLDLIIGNRPSSFAASGIKPYWLERNGKSGWMSRMSKEQLARKIAQWISRKWDEKN